MNTLILTIEDGLARLTLDRPEAANAMNPEMTSELREAAVMLHERDDVRAVLISGSGGMFCGGGDVRSFGSSQDGLAETIAGMTIDLHAAVSRLARLEVPVVAAVQGAAGGAGMSLAVAADLVVAGESAKFRMGYVGIGLAPDGSSSWFLARVVGLKRALDLMLTNRVLSAPEAESWGLVSRVVPDDEVLERAEDLARSLASGATMALGAAKRLALSGANAALEEAMENESLAIAATARTVDVREGVAAFLGKRFPEFEGR